jgi:hypothetical protein
MIALNPRSRIFRGLTLFVFAFQLGIAQGEPDSLAALESAIRKETEKPKTSGLEKRDQPRDAGLILLSQLREAIRRNDGRQTDAALAQIVALFESAPVRAVASKLRGELQVEQAAREKEMLAKIRAVLASASTAVKTARKPVDLDGTIRDLRNLAEQPQQSESPEIREESRKAQNARQFVLVWQDYLAADAAGNAQRAQQALQNASGIATDLMPRSQILSRADEISKRKSADPAEPARQIAAKIKSLDDIPGALDALAALEPKPGISAGDYQGLVETLRLELSRISQVYREYQAGLPTSLQISGFDAPTRNEETFRIILPLRVQLLRTILPRALEVDEKLQINPDEPIRGYLDRVAAIAFEKGDLRLLVRARDMRNKLDGVLLSNDTLSVSQSLLAGLNQEEAGQWAAAVVSYETALKYGADVVPAKHIGERLEKMKAAHPREFEQGFQRFMTGLQSLRPNPAPNAADKIAIPEAPVQPVSPASPP